MLLKASLGSGELALRAPYIYGIYSCEFGVLYIGQTISSMGAIGRLAQHLGDGDGSTFRKRIAQVFSYDEVDLDRLSSLHIDYLTEENSRKEFLQIFVRLWRVSLSTQ